MVFLSRGTSGSISWSTPCRGVRTSTATAGSTSTRCTATSTSAWLRRANRSSAPLRRRRPHRGQRIATRSVRTPQDERSAALLCLTRPDLVEPPAVPPSCPAVPDRAPNAALNRRNVLAETSADLRFWVGLDGIEPSTSALSVLRSNRLSYSPRGGVKLAHLGRLPANGFLGDRTVGGSGR